MPVWENYDVEAELTIRVKADGKTISHYTVYGEAPGTSNEGLGGAPLPAAIRAAVDLASQKSATMAAAVRRNRRKELGYRDGD
jgi:hypothetical protein